jgi:hypothetical protein
MQRGRLGWRPRHSAKSRTCQARMKSDV